MVRYTPVTPKVAYDIQVALDALIGSAFLPDTARGTDRTRWLDCDGVSFSNPVVHNRVELTTSPVSD